MSVTYSMDPEISVESSPYADRPYLYPALDRQRLLWVLAIGIAGLVAGILWARGITAFPLVLVAAAAAGLGLAQVSDLRVGLLGSLAVILGGFAILLHFTDTIPWGLAAIGGVSLLALVLGGMAFLLRSRALILPMRRATIRSAILIALALLVTVVFIPWQTTGGRGPVWAMHNDAVIQMIKARVLINAGGFDMSNTANSSPLTSALVAVVATVGRISVTNSDRWLENDVLRLAELWGLLVLASSALAAWIVWRMTVRVETESIASSQHRPVLAGLIGSALPFTWYFSGFAFAFGFLNSTLSLVILLLSWAIWLELPGCSRNQVSAEGGAARALIIAGSLSLTSVAMLATWAPLALIPAGLTILALWRAVRGIAALRTAASPLTATRVSGAWYWLAWVLAALPVPLYGLLVTLPDFGREGDALAIEGGILPIPINHLFMVAVFAAVGIAGYALVTKKYQVFGALIALLLGSALILGVLVQLNTRVGLPAWGYYPVKAAWSITSLLLIVGFASWCAAIATIIAKVLSLRHQLFSTAGLLVVSLITVALMWQYAWQPVGIRNFFAPLEILRSSGFASGPWRANILFDSYLEDELTIWSLEDERWMVPDQVVAGDGRADQFSNFWQLQVHPGAGFRDGPEHQARAWAYTLDPRNPSSICGAMEAWGGTTRVLTIDITLERQLREICPGSSFSVELNQPIFQNPNYQGPSH